MATKLACYGDKIVALENGDIVRYFIIEEEFLKAKIDSIISNRETIEPSYIFKKAVEDITGEMFGIRGNIPQINGQKESIHDQAIYKKWRNYILSNEEMKICYKRLKEEKIKDEEKVINSYFSSAIIQKKVKYQKRMNLR